MKGRIPTAIVHVYGEDHRRIDTEELREIEKAAALVYNSATVGPVIADKEKARVRLCGAGVLMPEADMGNADVVFSNSRLGTSQEVSVVYPGQALDADRYNTRYIDTTVDYRGKKYYTTIRLLCISDRIVHAYVRARDVAEGSPSVHAKDTPLDPELLAHLQSKLVEGHRPQIQNVADRIFSALGPGFYAHDLMIEANTQKVYVCETNFKFDDSSFSERTRPISGMIPFHQILFPLEGFASECARTLALDIQSRMAR